MPIEKVSIVGNGKSACWRIYCQGVSQAKIAKLVMMSIALTVCRNIDQWARSGGPAHKTFDKLTARGERLFERDRLSYFLIIEKHRDGPPGTIAMEIVIGNAWINRVVVNWLPAVQVCWAGCQGRGRKAYPNLANTCGL